jgi:hypothetical protein
MSLPLLTKEFWGCKILPEKLTLKKVSKKIYRETGKNKKERNSIIKFGVSSKTLIQLDFQKMEFIKSVTNGTFYEDLIEVFENKEGMILGSSPSEKRKKVKKMVYTLLFDDHSKPYNRTSKSRYQMFKRMYSSVTKVFEFVKKGDYRTLAAILQRTESHLVLDKICGRIAKERPYLPIFTIHDNIVTTVGNEDYVQEVMKEELTKAIGKPPKFSFEYWQGSKGVGIAAAA